MRVSEKIGVVVALVVTAAGIGIASLLFYDADINEPIPTGNTDESVEMMDISLVNVTKMPLAIFFSIMMSERAISTELMEEIVSKMGISTEEMGDILLDSFNQLDEDGEIRQMIESDPNEMVLEMLMNAAARTETQATDDDLESIDSIPIIIGNFEGIGGYHASGIAKIINVDEVNYLRFEDFTVTNGPDLRVYVTLDGNVDNGIQLEKLNGSRGAQNYMLGDIDVIDYSVVVIYCQPFGEYFASADLKYVYHQSVPHPRDLIITEKR